ncbi:MAG: leucine-rich repeat domain-containing protein [Clostridia bacterium]|nr:leucine-rich repeat domain-containing protein [Clostridia bacterium]
MSFRSHFGSARARARLAVCLTLLALLSLAAGCASSVRVGGQRAPLDATSLDLKNAGVTDVSPLIKLEALERLDLRGNDIAAADYERLRAALPDCEILWSVPLAGVRADSDAESLTLPGFTAADAAMLEYFDRLRTVDASGCTDYAALRAAAEAYPDCDFVWSVSVGGVTVPADAETLDLSGRTVGLEALAAALEGLPALREVLLSGSSLYAADVAALAASRPEIRFAADVLLLGERYAADTVSLDLSGRQDLDAEALLEALPAFTQLETVDLRGCGLSNAQKQALLAALPALRFGWEVELLPGLLVDSAEETLVVEGFESPDLDALIEGLALLPELRTLDLCACYAPSDETNVQMERLMAACPALKVVWLVQVGNWELRTDITAFSMGDHDEFPGGRFLGGAIYPSARDETIVPLKYCTDLIALDIGHAKRVTDISCLASLTKMRYLILGMTSITSLEALAGMTELEFLECYQCWISDLSPLLNCKQLKYLNCSTTFVETIDDLVQMTQLKRLWIMKPQVLTKTDIAAVKEALPNTIIRSISGSGDHSTMHGWRTKNPAYLYMQQTLYDLPLQDQNVRKVGDPEYWDWDLEAFEAQ